MSGTVVIAGSDTGVGKTLVGRALARRLHDAGVLVRAVKPVESDTAPEVAGTEDGVLLAEAARQDVPKHALWRLRAPLAPPAAAELDGVTLDLEEIVAATAAALRGCEVGLVEGAGGWLSPLTWHASIRDVAVRLDARVLLVACNRLGVLNHVLLTVESIAACGLELAGVVLSAPASADGASERNLSDLARVRPDVPAAVLPRVGGLEEAVLRVEAVAGWLAGGGE